VLSTLHISYLVLKTTTQEGIINPTLQTETKANVIYHLPKLASMEHAGILIQVWLQGPQRFTTILLAHTN